MAKVATRADVRAVCSGQEIEDVGRIGENTGPGRRRNTNFFTTYTYMYLEYQYSIRFAWAVLYAPQNPTRAVIRSMTLLVLVSAPTLEVSLLRQRDAKVGGFAVNTNVNCAG